MRGPTVDTRLEAIAGVPVVDTHSFTRLEGITYTVTAIFVGRYEVLREEYSSGQGTLSIPGEFFRYVRAGLWGPKQGQAASQSQHGADIFCVAVTSSSPTLVIGAAGNATSPDVVTAWQGPFRALVFDYVLTDFQIERLTRMRRNPRAVPPCRT